MVSKKETKKKDNNAKKALPDGISFMLLDGKTYSTKFSWKLMRKIDSLTGEQCVLWNWQVVDTRVLFGVVWAVVSLEKGVDLEDTDLEDLIPFADVEWTQKLREDIFLMYLEGMQRESKKAEAMGKLRATKQETPNPAQ